MGKDTETDTYTESNNDTETDISDSSSIVFLLLRRHFINWNTKLYTDLPNRMLKVQVIEDRSIIQCNENESSCLQHPTV